MNGWMDSTAKGFSASCDPCLSPLFQGHFIQVQSGCFYLLVSAEFDGPSVDRNNHSHQRNWGRQTLMETALDSNTELEAAPCPDHREGKCWVHPELCTSSHLQTQNWRGKGPIGIIKGSSQDHLELHYRTVSTIQVSEIW